MEIELSKESWSIGDQIGSGGFGKVYAAQGPLCEQAVAKFVPMLAGSRRELLIASELDPTVHAHIVPIIDSGEHADSYVLIMPRAGESLRDHLGRVTGLELAEVHRILADVAKGLVELEAAGIVHRDLKPENVLLLEGRWSLCDFGIARYHDATTAPDTRKFSMTPPYAAPEQWRSERVTSATDVYSFGVMAYEVLNGTWPFSGPSQAEFRDQHLHQTPNPLTQGSLRLRQLIEDCLDKSPDARPQPKQLVSRLDRVLDEPAGTGASKLAAASRAIGMERAEAHAREQRRLTEMERRGSLFQSAQRTFASISATLLDAIQTESPDTAIENFPRDHRMDFVASLGVGRLGISKPFMPELWAGPFEVIACCVISVNQENGSGGYQGRAHSLWYCDAKVKGAFGWYELAFMETLSGQPEAVPFSGTPQETEQVFQGVMGGKQLAWPLGELDRGDLSEFTDRWLGWFAGAIQRSLSYPSRLPELPTQGTFRRS